ncbi:MAG TPA: glycoside hydrolase family 2 TIM barrel-domain containing protein [Lachnospiraceae bacterium]|nr:glycoside hydrolase family 2 TIM barrel-domain containing protein [Lachnospiraceae bacterium]
MIRQNFNRHWNFKSTNAAGKIVDLPHDFSIIQERDPNASAGRGNGFFQGGVAEYVKSIYAPLEWKGKSVILEFEGVYMNTAVRVNSNIVAQQPYGYTSFHCDLTPFLRYGEDNILNVHVNNSALPNSRWYTGSGIYRSVWLMVGDGIHIKPWGVYATTPKVSADASTISVKTVINNQYSSDNTGKLRTTLIGSDGAVTVTTETAVQLQKSSSTEAEQELVVSPAHLWSVDDPYLYTLRSEVIVNDTVIDMSEMQIGIRSISFSSKDGFRLNGIQMKLKGGNVHHDCGILGAAAYRRAEERKVELLKVSGFNAVRCSHNPPSPDFLNACDRLGMLVIDEAFDCWCEEKLTNDYHLFFNDWWERDLKAMVLRDRNHPSIIMWSIGNEVKEREGKSDGCLWTKRLVDYIRSLDYTRAITNGINEVEKSPESFVAPLDVVGYNYGMHHYEKDAIDYPDRVICATENYIWETFDYWMTEERYPNVIGDFYWTSLDYLGEPGVGKVRYVGDNEGPQYPWHQAHCGDIDICGFKRPQSFYRDCIWGISQVPYIAVYKPQFYGVEVGICGWAWHDVVPSWTWPEFVGKPIVVEVYSRDEEIELFLNGKTLGRKPAGKANKYIATFELTYEPGELKAVAYREGREVSSTMLSTAGAPAMLKLIPDRNHINAEFGDLSYVTVEILDAQGNLVSNTDNNVYFTVCGVGEVLAVGNSNPISEEMYVGNQRRIYEGRAMVVIRANGEPGNITLTAMTDGIPSVSTSICVK